jgi:hypothetical protein
MARKHHLSLQRHKGLSQRAKMEATLHRDLNQKRVQTRSNLLRSVGAQTLKPKRRDLRLNLAEITLRLRRPSSIMKCIWILRLVDSEVYHRISSCNLRNLTLVPSRYKITQHKSLKYLTIILNSRMEIRQGKKNHCLYQEISIIKNS